jgi:hypothetical protein
MKRHRRPRPVLADSLPSRLLEWLRQHGPATTSDLVRAFASERTGGGKALDATRIGVALNWRVRATTGDVVRDMGLWRWVPEAERTGPQVLSQTRAGPQVLAQTRAAVRDVARDGDAARDGSARGKHGQHVPRPATDAARVWAANGSAAAPPRERVQLVVPDPPRYAGDAAYAEALPRTFRPNRPWVPPPMVVRHGALDHRRLPSRIGETVVAYAGVECAG